MKLKFLPFNCCRKMIIHASLNNLSLNSKLGGQGAFIGTLLLLDHKLKEGSPNSERFSIYMYMYVVCMLVHRLKVPN